MMSQIKIILLFVIVILSFSTILNFSLMQYIHGEEDYGIPSWLLHLEQWDSQGKISNSEYIQAVEYALKQGLLQRQTAEELTEVVTPSSTPDKDDKCWDRNFPNVDWHGCDMSGMNLNHADLDDANLEGVNLSHATLFKANLAEAHLDNAILDNAEMTNIDLPESHLSGASFVGVDAPFSDFNLMNAINTNFTNANLHDSSMRWAHTNGLIFKGANLNHMLFMNSDLSGSDFRGANLADAGFAYDNLTNVNFDGVNLMNVDLGSAIITGTHLHCINNPICN